MSNADHGYGLVKSRLLELLRLIRIGVVFHRAEGDSLFYSHEGREVEVLDLVGGFGSLLLGHNHPALLAEAQAILGRSVGDTVRVSTPSGNKVYKIARIE